MAVYVVGDVQGCLDALQRLLKKIDFDGRTDKLWFAGDLVNRGPDSLSVLRFVKHLGDCATSVLGNHDLHLLAVAAGKRKLKCSDTFGDVLRANDSKALLNWLRARPLMKTDAALNCSVVHAGLLPEWSIGKANALAREVEAKLRSDDYKEVLEHMYGDQPRAWRKGLKTMHRTRVVINAMTRMRFYSQRQGMDFNFKGSVGCAPEGYEPWFKAWQKGDGHTVLFGHWSALGAGVFDNAISLDSGCVWGGQLTAARIDRRPWELTGVKCVRCAPKQVVKCE